MRAETMRERALHNEGREVPHRSHVGCHHERVKRRTDKVRRANDKQVTATELRIAGDLTRDPSRRP
jgi:hypothetical protein